MAKYFVALNVLKISKK